jgi:hypothetical protein
LIGNDRSFPASTEPVVAASQWIDNRTVDACETTCGANTCVAHANVGATSTRVTVEEHAHRGIIGHYRRGVVAMSI